MWYQCNTVVRISIHALLAESDIENTLRQVVDRSISIHALLAESDRGRFFYFIPSSDFYPRSPCGERRKVPLLGIK